MPQVLPAGISYVFYIILEGSLYYQFCVLTSVPEPELVSVFSIFCPPVIKCFSSQQPRSILP